MKASSMLSRCLVARLRRAAVVGEQLVGERLEPHALDHRRVVVVDRQDALRAAWRSRPGRCWSRSGTATSACELRPSKRSSAAPRPQQRVLQRVLGVLDGAEHPVAVRVQLAAMRLDEAPVGGFVVGECGRAHLRSEGNGSGRPARTTKRWPAGVDVVLDRSGTPPGPVRCSSPRPSHARRRRRRGGAGPSLSVLFVLIVMLAALGYGGYEVVRAPARHRRAARDGRAVRAPRGRRATTRRCTRCSTRRRRARTRRSPSSPTTGARTGRRGVEKVTIGRIGPLLSGGTVRVPVTVKTKDFGTLKGTLTFKATRDRGRRRARRLVARAAPARRAQGRGGPPPQRRGTQPRQHLRRRRQAAELRPTGASIAGTAGKKPTGLERIYDDRLGGAPQLVAALRRPRDRARSRAAAGRSITHHDPARPATHRAERAGRAGWAASR